MLRFGLVQSGDSHRSKCTRSSAGSKAGGSQNSVSQLMDSGDHSKRQNTQTSHLARPPAALPAICHSLGSPLIFDLALKNTYRALGLSTRRRGPVEEPPRAERVLRGGGASFFFSSRRSLLFAFVLTLLVTGCVSPCERDRWRVFVETLSMVLPFTSRGTEQRVSRCNIEIRVDGPCQVVPYVFLVRHGVNVLATGQPLAIRPSRRHLTRLRPSGVHGLLQVAAIGTDTFASSTSNFTSSLWTTLRS